jgi:hypothetical protein
VTTSLVRRASILLLLTAFSGCATLQQMSALRNVDFSLDRLSRVRLAGIDLAQIRSWDDLGYADAARLALAVAQKSLPMDFQAHLLADNPEENDTEARLIRMDWTLLLQERETVSGVFEEEVVIPPGEPTDIPLTVSLNLVDFFEGSAQDLVELALSIAGAGGAPKDVALRATPVINTPLGPIRYPQPITILNREVGNEGNTH